MTYSVKEIFYSLQGEGANSGRTAVFCRFAGCNLWSGEEADRADATCQFCDTDFLGTEGIGGGTFDSPAALADAIRTIDRRKISDRRPSVGHPGRPDLVVLTGGEPLLQLDVALLEQLHAANYEVAVETNGTLLPPPGIDWICVSPKAQAELRLRRGQELKLVYPQAGLDPAELEGLDFDHFFLQPMAGPELDRNTKLATAYCLAHPRWRLSLQTQNILGIR